MIGSADDPARSASAAAMERAAEGMPTPWEHRTTPTAVQGDSEADDGGDGPPEDVEGAARRNSDASAASMVVPVDPKLHDVAARKWTTTARNGRHGGGKRKRSVSGEAVA